MIAVIQCAASKRPGAGHLLAPDGRPIKFVAHPQEAPVDDAVVYARPDDPSDSGMSWRDVLLNYNQQKRDNPLGLYPAHQLYDNAAYGRLVKRLGVRNVYILSAGWGLIGADLLTPCYDITFSPSARGPDAYKRRRRVDKYLDLCLLPEQTREHIVFFGGKDYLPLFCALTARIKGPKTVFFNSIQLPHAFGCVLTRFATRTKTNWHYECANAFLDHEIQLDISD